MKIAPKYPKIIILTYYRLPVSVLTSTLVLGINYFVCVVCVVCDTIYDTNYDTKYETLQGENDEK